MEKKQLIMDKAVELFAKQGFEATSIQQITDHCGISKGAFYLSFKSKDALIVALIDHFMIQFTENIDYEVKSTKNVNDLLYNFYYAVFHSFHEHSDFAKILMKEMMQSFDEELFLKFHDYNGMMEKVISSMVERLYEDQIEQTKYDLMYCIKGLMKTYSELFIFYELPLDLDLLARSLSEKTMILAENMTIPFISNEMRESFNHPLNEKPSQEQILDILEQNIAEMEASIEKESLVLLKQQLLEPTLSPPLVNGLLENIRKHPHCKWAAYLLRNHFKLEH
ncbi:TetR/AcrR family transcriptional regulator [Sporosarcina sp. HYO08]|uniref:TetR/AcrR family transcriptional regulator n=1 Tax=Sporosarcina sp. HYO08 TaxID=1759557 RepID=UPI0007999CB1|nr:TetR/AcrR family transcriptional regulator [Sporosarcina sp. HYO08]KXH80641.1 transcriptional regulator [Sporosarcina sp. HYO08]